eukprot:7254370-Lingulodinium_polyedra.AAC.1
MAGRKPGLARAETFRRRGSHRKDDHLFPSSHLGASRGSHRKDDHPFSFPAHAGDQITKMIT